MKIPTWAILFAFILLAMVGSFFAGNYLVRGTSYTEATPAADIVEEAKKAVPPVVLPPKPAGHSVTAVQHVVTQVPETHIENKMVDLGIFHAKTLIPQVVTTMKNVTTDVPTTTLVDASPEETAKWDQEVKTLQDKYQEDLKAKITEISDQRKHQRTVEIMEETKNIVTDMIIPLITALTGLIGALAAFKYGNKPSAGAG